MRGDGQAGPGAGWFAPPDIRAGCVVVLMTKSTPSAKYSLERGVAMKAVRTHEPAGISGLVYEEAPDAKPMFCEVLVKVAACGITHNELDWPVWTCRAGHQRTSIIPGHEVSGVVAALGFGTAGIAVGDEVFGLTDQLRDGSAAEYVAVETRNQGPEAADRGSRPRRRGAAGRRRPGRPCSTTGSWPRGRRWSSTARAARSDRWRSSLPAGPAPRSSGPGAATPGRWPPSWAPTASSRWTPGDLEDAAGQADLVFDTIGGDVLARSPALLQAGRDAGVGGGCARRRPPPAATSGRSSSSRSPAALS